MDEAQVLEICREAIMVTIKVGAPLMMVALIVGVIVSIIQTLTSIQEMTLTFVPKMMCIFFGFLLLLPFMLEQLITFTNGLADRIVAMGAGG